MNAHVLLQLRYKPAFLQQQRAPQMPPLDTLPEVRLVLPREAAKILSCSLRQIRVIAHDGKPQC